MTAHKEGCKALATSPSIYEDDCPRCQEIIAVKQAQGFPVVSTWSAAQRIKEEPE